MNVCAIALQGLERAQAGFERSATRIATAAEPGDAVDLSAAVAGLLAAKEAFALNLKVVQAADEMERRTIDLLA